SGCGKTTTLRMIAGLVQPNDGQIYIKGQPMRGVPPNKRDVGIVFQNYALFPHMTVAGNVAFGLEMRGVSRDDTKRRVGEALETVQLTGYDQRYPSQLSGGQQQRVALARAIVTRPAVLLLDEPLAALDKRLRMDMQIELKQLQRHVGITTIFVTHDQEEALTLSDQIVVMNQGKIDQLGVPQEIYEHPRTRFVLDFIGHANVFEGEIVRNGSSTVFRSGNLDLVAEENGHQPGPAILAVRPEHVRLSAERPATSANVLPATITNVVYLGSDNHYYAQVESGKQLLAFRRRNRDGGRVLDVGDQVWASWDPAASRILVA
ncbi:MAG: ABC transporter ATP-binding protein, partial [Chloroflexi bacterium]|nr:ABC transporter ATP-binding protein [Chloroflexota bacterium]